jgi:acyl-coenzyme A thioesterase PaaI-like protein
LIDQVKNISYWRRMLWLMGKFKIPMIAFVRPKLVQLDGQKVVLRIRLGRRSRNHLKSMYFGALAVGADTAAGLHAFYFSRELGVKPSFAFKSMSAEFHRRATDHVLFICEDGQKIRDIVVRAKQSADRINGKVGVKAVTVSGEHVADFIMEISVKILGR